MKALVAIKRVIDYKVRIKIKSDHSGVETNNIKMAMNPFDEIAVEEALRLKEKNILKEVYVVSIGPEECQDILRAALAMGADQAIHVKTLLPTEPLFVAKILSQLAKNQDISLFLMGKQAIDDDYNHTGQMTAALLGWPQACFASHIEMIDNFLHVTREIDGGLEEIRIQLPAVVTTDLRLNQPRYIKLPDLMKAKRQSIQILTPSDLNIEEKLRIQTLHVAPPETRKSGIKVKSIDELIEKLQNIEKIIP